ncbi:MAG: hypothetical protein MK186_04115 [Henriciella sp.]|nr:hypothetical protein [Henriciella sp.]
MLHPSTKKLNDRLAEIPALKQIDWAETEDGGVIYATEGYSVRLTDTPPQVMLATEKGKTLEEASEDLLKDTPHEEHGNYGELIVAVVKEASRIAKGTEAAIDALLAGLSGQSPNKRKSDTPPPADEVTMDAGAEDEEETDLPVDESIPPRALLEDEPEERLHAGFDEDDVSGAVARLADEVNGRGKAALAKAEAREKARPAEEAPSANVWDEAGPDEGESDLAAAAKSYVPFGLGGTQIAGADASNVPEAGAESADDIESELGAAAAGMTIPDNNHDDLSFGYAEDNDPGSAPLSYPLNLKGFRSRIDQAALSAATAPAQDDGDGPDPVSPADLDAVSPPAEDKSDGEADTELFDEGDEPVPQPKSSKNKGEDKKSDRPKRRKSRFNPWS